MAATQAKAGFGTKFQRGDGATPEVFTTIAEILDVSGPEIRQMLEDATHMESPDGFVEKIATVRESGDVTFQMHFLDSDSSQLALRNDLLAGTKRNFRILLPGGGNKRLAGSGYVQSIGAAAPVKGKLVSDVSIASTGKWVLEAS